MRFIGDIHGNFETYRSLIERFPKTIQLGDMGLGFGMDDRFPDDGVNHFFVRGNHDDPAVCRTMKSYLGDWGHLEVDDIFFVSGAYSIDRDMRTPGLDWWADEELPYEVLLNVIDTYKKIKPRIVISHDAPSSAASWNYKPIGKSRTQIAFDMMFKAHKPRHWVFGHHHRNWVQKIDGTTFTCVDSENVVEIA